MIPTKLYVGVGALVILGITFSVFMVLSTVQADDPPGVYDPAYYGLPETLGGYTVLVVETAQNTACRLTGNSKGLVLQAPPPSIEGFLATADVNMIYQELENAGFNRDDFNAFSFVSSGITRERIITDNQTGLHRPCPLPLGGPISLTPGQFIIIPENVSENTK